MSEETKYWYPGCLSILSRWLNDQASFFTKGNRAKEPLELIHSDVYGPINKQALGGYEYFVTFTNDYSRYGHVYLV